MCAYIEYIVYTKMELDKQIKIYKAPYLPPPLIQPFVQKNLEINSDECIRYSSFA